MGASSGPVRWEFGLDATLVGEIVSEAGVTQSRISAVGPPLRGVFWESNAIPEILPQIETLTRRLSEEFATDQAA